MNAALRIRSSDRIMVFAPHPDDETLAAGDLIQAAMGAGAAVRVLFATDGDNNPWPQRWLEKRWRIGTAERARWGMRRRTEAGAALATFGIDAGSSARFLGWPDQGLTDVLMRDKAAVDVLAQELATFAPTHLVMPVLADRHPDHSALRVLVELARLKSGSAGQRLGFLVHGNAVAGSTPSVCLDTPQPRLKTRALEAHASQVALSRRRLLVIANAAESYHVDAVDADAIESPPDALRIPYPPDASLRPHRFLLLIASAGQVLRYSAPMPRGRRGRAHMVEFDGSTLEVEWGANALHLNLPKLETPLRAVYAKMDRRPPRVVIFDKTCWLDIEAIRQLASSGSVAGVVSAHR